jgi:UDP-perosamine 4-acetyltransferase
VSEQPHRPVVVIGSGGHAKVVLSTLECAGWVATAVLDDDRSRWGRTLFGLQIQGPIAEFMHAGRTAAVIAIGCNAVRERLSGQFVGVDWVTVVHPRAYVHPSATLGPGTVVFAGAVVQPDASLGAHVILNTSATVDHDSRIGDFAHLAPGSHVAGGVRIGRGAFLGIGSVVIPQCRIGEWCTIGAGAAVLRDVPDRVTAVGVPAKPLRSTDP